MINDVKSTKKKKKYINKEIDKEFDENELAEKINKQHIQIDVVNKILQLHPELKNDKQLLEKILQNNCDTPKMTQLKTYDKLIINNKIYYKDNNDNIVDENRILMGFVNPNPIKNNEEYILFV